MQPFDFSTRAHLWYAGHGPRRLAFLLARIHPEVITLERFEDCWQLETTDATYYLSDPRQITRIVGLGTEMDGRVRRKYTKTGFVEVEPGDTVVDVGAFIGEFSRSVGEIADRVVAIEPDEGNAVALGRNLEHLSRAEVVQKAVWNETGERSFQRAADPSEGSILGVDSSDITDVVNLETVRIDDMVADLDLEGIDFLKVEAEGAEPEVLEGIGNVGVSKLAVECAPEREGRTPEPEIREWLHNNGYDVKAENHIVFGLRDI